ncbi:MAG: hypothetical protein M1836_005611 [Candelina mexicana]|nr:MAG: hypothetical protein M1836_005611 [Candelina mexicana]
MSSSYAPHLSTYDPNTPPPPPPKSHDPSRIGTPQDGPPVPPSSTASEARQRPLSSQYQDMTMQSTLHPSQEEATQNPTEPEEGWLPEILKDKTKPDLHHLLTTPSLLHALSSAPSTTHPSVPAAQHPLSHLLTQNLSLAHSLLALQQTLSTQRTTTESHLLHLHSLEHQWRSTQTRMDSALAPFSPKALYQRLAQSIGEQEQVCAALEESFLEGEEEMGEREVGEFLKRFREAKKVERLRRERKARWDEGRVGGWR